MSSDLPSSQTGWHLCTLALRLVELLFYLPLLRGGVCLTSNPYPTAILCSRSCRARKKTWVKINSGREGSVHLRLAFCRTHGAILSVRHACVVPSQVYAGGVHLWERLNAEILFQCSVKFQAGLKDNPRKTRCPTAHWYMVGDFLCSEAYSLNSYKKQLFGTVQTCWFALIIGKCERLVIGIVWGGVRLNRVPRSNNERDETMSTDSFYESST